jgi:hypothetical protein
VRMLLVVCVRYQVRSGVRMLLTFIVVYYESIKRELKIRCIYECRCDERLHLFDLKEKRKGSEVD